MTDFLTTARGDRVGYDRRGTGPALIFVAGAGPFRAIDPWTTTTAELAADQGLTTIVFDRLGRGESPAGGRLDLERELVALDALIELAGGQAALCGHSSGCSIALAAAASGRPITALALWEAPLSGAVGGVKPWIDEFERRLDDGDLEGAVAQYMKDMPPEWLEGMRGTPMYDGMVAQVGSQRADGESLVWADSAPHAELFAGIDVPVQVMLGEQTFDSMFAGADSIVAAIGGATQKRMPGADHAWEPAPMAAELAAFVQAAAAR